LREVFEILFENVIFKSILYNTGENISTAADLCSEVFTVRVLCRSIKVKDTFYDDHLHDSKLNSTALAF